MITNKTNTQLVIQCSGAWMLLPASLCILLGMFGMAVGLFAHGAGVFAALGLLFIAVGLTAILKASNQQTVIKHGETVTVTAKKLVGGKTTSKEYTAAAISSIRYQATYDSPQSAQYRAGSSIFLVMKDKAEVQVDFQWAYPYPRKTVNWKTPAREPLAQEARAVAEFLEVPLTGPASPASVAGGWVNARTIR